MIDCAAGDITMPDTLESESRQHGPFNLAVSQFSQQHLIDSANCFFCIWYM